jgi:NADH-quinone oxidoreductase subunit C
VTSNQSETTAHPLQDLADRVTGAVGGTSVITFDTVKVKIPPDAWVETHRVARDQLGMVFFSWLSAVDWANQVEAGDPLSEEIEERIELLSTLSDVTEGERVTFTTDLSREVPVAPSLIEIFPGANWHEREAHEMFGIDFDGHPDLSHLYLPDSFVGNPLRKSFPLLSREVKPWPGTVDVEGMPDQEADDEPSTENPEA